MHGIVFASLRDYVAARAGLDAARETFGDSVYGLAEAYPDDELAVLLTKASAVTTLSPDALLRDFGAFTTQTMFTRLYPAFFDLAADTRSFLLTVETRIHELVRATIPGAEPPQLSVKPAADGEVDIVYGSPRRLCAFLEGLVSGTAAHYRESAEFHKHTCLKKDDPACVYRIRFQPLPSEPHGRR